MTNSFAAKMAYLYQLWSYLFGIFIFLFSQHFLGKCKMFSSASLNLCGCIHTGGCYGKWNGYEQLREEVGVVYHIMSWGVSNLGGRWGIKVFFLCKITNIADVKEDLRWVYFIIMILYFFLGECTKDTKERWVQQPSDLSLTSTPNKIEQGINQVVFYPR